MAKVGQGDEARLRDRDRERERQEEEREEETEKETRKEKFTIIYITDLFSLLIQHSALIGARNFIQERLRNYVGYVSL